VILSLVLGFAGFIEGTSILLSSFAIVSVATRQSGLWHLGAGYLNPKIFRGAC
jgi:hypothetical protein